MKKLFGLGGVVLALTITACVTSPTGRTLVKIFSDSEMHAMGTAAFTSIQQEQKVDTSHSNNRYVNCIVDALIPELNRLAPNMQSIRWETRVFADDSPNAFALPGGKIGVHSGMFKVADNAAQLAAVLGHEIGHVWAGHGNARLSRDVLGQVALEQLAAPDAGAQQNQQIYDLLGVAVKVGGLSFSRDDESESDEIGLQLMAKAGFDPRASVQLWQNMSAIDSTQSIEFLSTHPANQTRIDDLKRKMPQALNWYRQAQAQGKRPDCQL